MPAIIHHAEWCGVISVTNERIKNTLHRPAGWMMTPALALTVQSPTTNERKTEPERETELDESAGAGKMETEKVMKAPTKQAGRQAG